MAAARAICPVCGESTVYAPGATVDLACPRCGSTFHKNAATLVDSQAASRAFAESAQLTQPLPATPRS